MKAIKDKNKYEPEFFEVREDSQHKWREDELILQELVK